MSINKQSGAVSLFLVIFAMLLITIVTVSFLRLMINDQNQASQTDLSQSAYDSAQAGVEDAKRALLRYQQVCSNSPSDCAALSAALSTTECNEALLIGGVVSSANESGGDATQTGEIKIQKTVGGNDAELDQAYTCVTMKLETEDYVGKIDSDASQLVPLIGATSFDTVVINWFSKNDVTNATGTVNLPALGTGQPLVIQSQWPTNRPSIMRSQLIQFGTNFTLDDFNYVNSSSQSNANTLFLYPQADHGDSFAYVGRDLRKTSPTDDPDKLVPGGDVPLPVKCKNSVASGGFACSISLTLPEPIGGGNRTAFMRLTPIYNSTEFQVLLKNGGVSGAPVRFKGVQPEIDSTGRANDLFRRVQSRVDLYDTTFPYPEATIDVTGNFCKDFGVTDTTYIAGSCAP